MASKDDKSWWCPIIEDWVPEMVHRDPTKGIRGATVQCDQGRRTYANGVPVMGIDFRTTDAGLLKLWRAHAESIEPLASVPEGFREEIAFNFTPCQHERTQIFELESDRGTWGIEVCSRCAVMVAQECKHDKCQWHLEGKILVCPNCGVDAT